jgi:hypothetical protein
MSWTSGEIVLGYLALVIALGIMVIIGISYCNDVDGKQNKR